MTDDRRDDGGGDPLEPRDPLNPYGPAAPSPTRRRAPAPEAASDSALSPTAGRGASRLLLSPMVALFTGLVMFGGGFLAGRMIAPPAATADLRPIDEKLAALASRLDELSAALETRDERLTEGLGRIEAPAAGLAPLTEKLDALASRLDGLSPATRLDAIDGRLGTLAGGVESLAAPIAKLGERLDQQQAALQGLGDRLKEQSGSPPPASSTPPAAAAETTESELSRASELFRQAEYGPALEILGRLQKETARDARVWYFSALATGLSTGVWTGEAVRLVEHGVELERAGPTTPQQVETAFTGLTQPNAKAWLDYYRRRGR